MCSQSEGFQVLLSAADAAVSHWATSAADGGPLGSLHASYSGMLGRESEGVRGAGSGVDAMGVSGHVQITTIN
eukprot:scaffold128025_cov35-Prasinocladus_malaysianus.AAC.1